MNDKRLQDAFEAIARRAVPESANLWPRIAAQIAERPSLLKTLRARPLVAILLALLVLLTLSGLAYAAAVTLGVVPGIGVVENVNGLRLLPQPVTVTRAGVSLTVQQVLVFEDRVKLVYAFAGVSPSAEFGLADADNESAFCFGPDAEARLRLPDGTVLRPASPDIYAQQPTFLAAIPADVQEMTVLLPCLRGVRLGAAPENWEIPLRLVFVPAGAAVGEPLAEATPQPTLAGTASTPPLAPGAASTQAGGLIRPFDPDYLFGRVIGLARPEVGPPGDQTRLCLKWLSLAPVSVDYQASVRLVTGQGAVERTWDFSPGGGDRPTSAWTSGEAFEDCLALDASEFPAAGWRLTVGLYDPASGLRLRAYDRAGQPLPNDEVVLSPR